MYPSDAACSYVIDIQHTGATSVVIRFDYFELELGFDFLYFGSGTHVDISRALGSFTGIIIPDDLEVLGNQLWFHFSSDRTVEGRGFSVTWYGTGNFNLFKGRVPFR